MMSILTFLPFMVCLTVLISAQSSNAGKKGLTIELIHRESPLSPFYNSSDTYSTRLRKSILRSTSRANHFHLSSLEQNAIQSDVTLISGEYMMKFSIGTPPVEVLAIADTGSDLIWTQCDPCTRCFSQNTPVFNSLESSTYQVLTCNTSYCQALSKNHCDQQTRNCQYSYEYGDKSSTAGVLAKETLTFDSSSGQVDSRSNIVFGCGQQNVFTINSNATGIVGLGGGPLSLVSQLSSEFGGKFSYCLVAETQASSKLRFGDEAVISANGMVSTPFRNDESGTFYYLTLEGVSIGNQRLDMQSAADNPGNIIIDSGTTLTYLNADFYNVVASAVQGAIGLDPVPDAEASFQFCYSNTKDLVIPEMTFHFTGADLKLGRSNTFVQVSTDLVCFTLRPSSPQDSPIFGNLAQVNFQVEYDLHGKKVSFAPANCTNV